MEEFNYWLFTWLLLPLALIIITIINLSDKKFRETKGNIKFLYNQLVFSIIIAIISYGIVHFEIPNIAFDLLQGFVSLWFIQWAVYPLVLLITATFLEPKKK